MSISDDLEAALKSYGVETQRRLARRILRISQEEPLPENLRTYIRVLKVLCPVAVAICLPLVGFAYSEMAKGTLSPGLFLITLVPLVFISAITAIVDGLVKLPSE